MVFLHYVECFVAYLHQFPTNMNRRLHDTNTSPIRLTLSFKGLKYHLKPIYNQNVKMMLSYSPGRNGYPSRFAPASLFGTAIIQNFRIL